MTQLIERLRALVGDAGLITDPQEARPYATDWRKRYFGKPLAVVKPASTAEVAAVMRCAPRRARQSCRRAATPACAAAPRRTRRRADRAQPVAHEPHARGRCGQQHHDRRGGLRARQCAAGRSRGRPPVSAVARGRRQLRDRRQSVHQCRRHRGAALRQCARSACSGWKWCCPTGRSGTACAACARTIPATT